MPAGAINEPDVPESAFSRHVINLLNLLLLYNRRLQHLLQFDGRVIYRTYTTAPYRIIEERFI